MATRGKPEIRTGQSLDVQPGVSNIGENQATLEALRNANIDGQDVFPQSVSTRRFSAEDGAFSGNMYAGSLLVGSNGVTVTSGEPGQANPASGLSTGLSITSSGLYLFKGDVTKVFLDGVTGDASITGAITATSGTFTGRVEATNGYFVGTINIGTDTDVGVAATGLWITNERILIKKSGVIKVDINTSTSIYYFAGEIVASKITITSNAANSVNFGVDTTIGGNLIINSTMGKKIYFDGSSGTNYIEGVSGGSFMHLRGGTAVTIDLSATASAAPSIVVSSSGIEMSVASADDIVLQGATNTTVSSVFIGLTASDDMDLNIGTDAGDLFRLRRGTTTVMSFPGNSNTVTFAGEVIAAGFNGPSGTTLVIESTTDPVQIYNSEPSSATGQVIESLAGAKHEYSGDVIYLNGTWNSGTSAYDSRFSFGLNGDFRLETAASYIVLAASGQGITFYNNSSTASVSGNSVLFHASGNIYFRDNGGTIHQLAYV